MIVGERFGNMIKTMLLKVSRFVNSAHSSIIYSPPSESRFMQLSGCGGAFSHNNGSCTWTLNFNLTSS